jgi:hypothetical protein
MVEINRVIAEASKVSTSEAKLISGIKVGPITMQLIRFYNNQVRKDEELTEKITWFRNKVGTMLTKLTVARQPDAGCPARKARDRCGSHSRSKT